MRSAWAFLVLTAIGAAACSSNNTSDGGGSTGPYSIAIFAGNAQTARPGAALATPLSVTVTNAGGWATGVAVVWSVTSGGGTLAAATSTTGAGGRASTVLTLGSIVGANTVQATVAGATDTAVFTETADTTTTRVTGPQLIASVPAPTGATYDHDSFVRDGLAFVCDWNQGVLIYDVGNGIKGGSPAHPQLISQLITATNGVQNGPAVHNAWWFHNPVTGENRYLFIGQEGPGTVGATSTGDIHIVDVSDLSNPHEVGFIHVPGAGTHNFWMDEANQTLYAAYYNAGVIKVDVSGTLSGDMSSRIVAQVQPGGAGNTYTWGVMLANGTLYASDMVSGFWALDPATLAIKGGGNNVPERFGSDLWVAGAWGYTGTWGDRTKGGYGNAIKVWSLDANGVPTLADSLIIPDITTVSDVAVTDDGTMLVATAEGGAGAGLYVYSRIDNPRHPTLVGSYLVPVGEHTGELATIKGRTYVFAARDPYQQQMDIFDITGLAH
jgi:hypothetical protein